ncbi:MAG: trimethylamine methyltransferase family protein [Candidatus Aminicenantes bacterium]|nr:MAG: trimethylamine methyltransferase family protein [Candidatus Aminicenantes bacterium]
MIKTIRPKLEFLSKEFIQKIISEAYGILEKEGVFIENKEAMNLLKEAGMKADESTQRVHITSELVENSLSSTPSIIKLYNRTGDKEFVVGEDQVHFDPGSAAITILDHNTSEERKAASEDLINFYRLTECLEYIHFQSTGIVSSDVPDLISDSYRLFLGLQFSTKPVVTGTFRVEGFKPMLDMLIAIRGSENNLTEKPLAIFDACPSPPLKWSNLTAQSLIDCARAGIPSELISMGMTGATSPVTIAGTLVQHTVENLSGLVICQLAEKGAPVIFGGSPSSFDMRKGTTPMGAIETMMIDSAYAQIGKHLNLPTHAYMALSDSKVNDAQAGFETGIGAVVAALSGVNVVSGPGMMNFESCQSLEKLVVDHEICRMTYRMIEGISQRDDPIAKNLFEGFTSESQFLSTPHTRKWYRQEHTFPKIIDRDTYDYWVSLGKKSIADRASEEVERLLRENLPSLPEKGIIQELQKIMLTDARNNGISSLPEIELD